MAGLLAAQVAVATTASASTHQFDPEVTTQWSSEPMHENGQDEAEASQESCDTAGQGADDVWGSESMGDFWSFVVQALGFDPSTTEASVDCDMSETPQMATPDGRSAPDETTASQEQQAPQEQQTPAEQQAPAEQQTSERPAAAEGDNARAALVDDYPARLQALPRRSAIDDWGYTARECTSFVAFRLETRNGFQLPRGLSDAKNWAPRLQSQYQVDGSPARGAIAWSPDGEFGHVAWVASVGDGVVTLEEYNYDVLGGYGTRTVPTDSYQYIHVKDL